MNRLVKTLILLSTLLSVGHSLADTPTADTPAAEETASSQILSGEYLWTQRDMSGPVEAKFTATEPGKWEVSFEFQFRSQSHVYTGHAEGSLTDGALSGEVQNENKKRTFTFKGVSESGVFKGEHAELRNGEVIDTGNITLKG